jgi:membrane protease YdiL (CAAX protease family)
MQFLGEPSKGINKLKNILFVFGIYALYIFGYQEAMQYMWAEGLLGLFFTLIFAPCLEEFVFRVGFIGLVKDKPNLLFPVIILSSALFGWLHGGAENWLVQGVMGFILACVYVKNGYSYWSVVLLHFLWNLYCVTILEKLA